MKNLKSCLSVSLFNIFINSVIYIIIAIIIDGGGRGVVVVDMMYRLYVSSSSGMCCCRGYKLALCTTPAMQNCGQYSIGQFHSRLIR